MKTCKNSLTVTLCGALAPTGVGARFSKDGQGGGEVTVVKRHVSRKPAAKTGKKTARKKK